ncbi:MAG: hypothetical protein ABR89_03780 [Rhodobacter sp. BACL10 MAG-120910-bin24]|nr:MAG: hypothetical protein ABR89_03780 [Rhodobacter sp. BACL10 MAG-120910-bin24]
MDFLFSFIPMKIGFYCIFTLLASFVKRNFFENNVENSFIFEINCKRASLMIVFVQLISRKGY